MIINSLRHNYSANKICPRSERTREYEDELNDKRSVVKHSSEESKFQESEFSVGCRQSPFKVELTEFRTAKGGKTIGIHERNFEINIKKLNQIFKVPLHRTRECEDKLNDKRSAVKYSSDTKRIIEPIGEINEPSSVAKRSVRTKNSRQLNFGLAFIKGEQLYGCDTRLNNVFLKNNTLERTPIKDTVSFCASPKTTSEYYLRIRKESDFPPRIYSILLDNVKNGKGNEEINLYEIQQKVYEGLKNCKTLDEAKKLYPEFEGVIPLKEMPNKEKIKTQNILDMIEGREEETEGDFALYVLKCSYRVKQNEIVNKDVFYTLEKRLNIPKLPTAYLKMIQLKRLWTTPEFQKKHQDSLTPESRKRRSEATMRLWQTPEFRQKQKEINLTPESIKKRSEITTKLWERPEFREKRCATMNRYWANPQAREAQSELSKQQWQNPEYRQKMEQIHTSDEFRQRRSIITRNLWQDTNFRIKQSHFDSIRSQGLQNAWAKMDEGFKQNAKNIRKNNPRYEYVVLKYCRKKPLTEAEDCILKKYFKECWEYSPDSSKTFGKLYKLEYQKLKIEYINSLIDKYASNQPLTNDEKNILVTHYSRYMSYSPELGEKKEELYDQIYNELTK